jgi:acyl-CoA thioester hydrolase
MRPHGEEALMNSQNTSRKPARATRADFRLFHPIATRWADNDVYGHVNNVVYYAWFDTAVNGWLVENGMLDPATSNVVGLVVDTACSYFESISFPETVEIGLAITQIGRSSVTYRLGVFKAGGEQAAAQGSFTHVYVDRATQTSVPVPDAARARMATLVISG